MFCVCHVNCFILEFAILLWAWRRSTYVACVKDWVCTWACFIITGYNAFIFAGLYVLLIFWLLATRVQFYKSCNCNTYIKLLAWCGCVNIIRLGLLQSLLSTYIVKCNGYCLCKGSFITLKTRKTRSKTTNCKDKPSIPFLVSNLVFDQSHNSTFVKFKSLFNEDS